MVSRGQKGSLSFPMSLILFVSLGSSATLITLFNHWKGQVRVQLELDECVGKTAHDLRDRMKSIERLNLAMTATRAALAVSTIAPPGRAALQATLQVEALEQQRLILMWRIKQAAWLTRRGCPESRGLPMPYPDFPWIQDPPDSLGPRPLRLPSPDPRLRIGLKARNRSSFAVVERRNEERKWTANWSNPSRLLSTSLD